MADEIYNPSTDNLEKREEPRLNPATGISNFITPKQVTARKLEEGKRQRVLEQIDAERKAMLDKREKALGKTLSVKQKPKKSMAKYVASGLLGMRKSRPIADKLKVLRLQNMLEKKRL